MKYSLAVLLVSFVTLSDETSLPDHDPGLLPKEESVPASIQILKELNRAPPLPPTTMTSNVETRWFPQWLDNFDNNNTGVWYNRVMINEAYFQDGSPIFIYLGGEWAIDESGINSGHWVDIAKEHNGSLLYTEHRFFGLSIPIRPLSTENLEKYQNVHQALADVRNIIRTLKQQDKYKDSKVVISGGSYSATMVVWFRRLYPNDIVGGWASSAPLVAKVDFQEFMKVVGDAYDQLGTPGCYDIIKNATSYYEDLFSAGKGAEAKERLNLCDNFDPDSEQDRWQIFSSIANIFAGIAQYQKAGDLWAYCSVLREFDEDDATALSKFIQWRLHNPQCVSARYKSTINYYKWSMDNYDGTGLAWTFQTCNEFGWYQSSGSSQQPFGSTFPATLYTDQCHDVFSTNYTAVQIQANVNQTNEEFGGLSPDVTNVYFTQGGLDPWHTVGAGVKQNATIIPYASHCSDFGSISDSDSPEMRASKLRLALLVRKWLA
ncbi:putative serine protease F56F10.1 [Scaptodrosophila lebanonensis]|uniref:Serine protease F56F10.1 n=1 Tax=Drosophila lebanonensis TaxID=7225 RepID=A0A6J2TG81_DROLE|nr:putative serine protease F56F10.1 [Scaptodrosophila lebanonensis]